MQLERKKRQGVQKMSKIEDTKGITLIALVITIIILLILAQVTIATLTDKNGILEKSKEAKIQYEIAQIKEQIAVEIMGEQAKNQWDITEKQLKDILEKYGTLSEKEENLLDKTLTTQEENYEIKVSDIFNGSMTKEPVVDKSGANSPNVSKISQKEYVIWNWNEEKSEYEINDNQKTEPLDWYDYENGKWANIKTTNKVSETEILEAYWVWIPRFEYIVPTSTTATQIEVKFINKEKITPDENYIIHPAFTNEGNGGFGELDGIWVAKFQASSNSPSTEYGGGNSDQLKVQIKPKEQTWRKIEVKNIVKVCRKMTAVGEVLQGSNVDSHMMKNIEWGAVAILSQSKYGIYNPQSSTKLDNGENRIWNNPNGYNSAKYIYTGYVGDTAEAPTDFSATTAPTKVIEYNKTDIDRNLNGTRGSTTGTVYGVYDMAGASWEYVAGCFQGEETSKFGLTANERKYVDLYTNSNNEESSKLGDAMSETKGWNGDYFNFVNLYTPVFNRGRWI